MTLCLNDLTADPYAEHDAAHELAEQKAARADVAVEYLVDSMMIDCYELQDAASLVHEHDLHDLSNDLLPRLMNLVAMAQGGVMTGPDALKQMNSALRSALSTVAEQELDK